MVKGKSVKSIILEVLRVICCVFFALLILVPICWVLFSSFRPNKEFLQAAPSLMPKTWTFGHYIELFGRLNVLRYVWNSVVYAAIRTVGNVIFCSMAGYAFGRIRFKGRDVLFTICLATMMIPFQIILVPTYLVIHLLGWLDTYKGLIVPGLAGAFGVFMIRGFFAKLPKDLEEAARIDGLNEYGIFLKIMLPLCAPIIITLTIFNFNGCWNDLLWPLLVTSTNEMRTLTIGLVSFVGMNTTNYGPAMAGAVIAMIPMFLMYIFGQKYFVESIATTGIKG